MHARVFTNATWRFFTDVRFLYMTCLRDPISRIKSSIKFHAQQTEELVVSWATKHEFRVRISVNDFWKKRWINPE
jgi:hypothetical protein